MHANHPPTDTNLIDPARLEAIRGAMDPLAIIGVFLYYMVKDLSGFEFSQDTLLWFVAAASAVRTMITRSIERIVKLRQDAIAHARELELTALSVRSASAARHASRAAKEATKLVQQTVAGMTAETSGVGDASIEKQENPEDSDHD